jgi:hypothetical protein
MQVLFFGGLAIMNLAMAGIAYTDRRAGTSPGAAQTLAAVMFVAFGIASLVAAYLGFRRRGAVPADAEARADAEHDFTSRTLSARRPYFVVMQYYAGILNRSYKVYVTERSLCAARVCGAMSAYAGSNPASIDPDFYVSRKLAARYEECDVESRDFTDSDRANFRLNRSSIVRIDFHARKWGMGLVPYSGRLVVHMLDGSRHELILVGRQDHETIQRTIVLGSGFPPHDVA